MLINCNHRTCITPVFKCMRDCSFQCKHDSYLTYVVIVCLFLSYCLFGSVWPVKKFVTPAIKAEWILYKTCVFCLQDIIKKQLIRRWIVSISHVYESHARYITGYVGFESVCLFWIFFKRAGILHQWIVVTSTQEDGREIQNLGSLLDALCSSLKVTYLIRCVLTFPLDVLRTCTDRPIVDYIMGNRVWRITTTKTNITCCNLY
jgi:hypothetical protein